MTWWAKLLTVVILILSVVFAAMSSVIFAQRSDLRNLLAQARTAHDEDNKQAVARIQRLENEKLGLTAELTRANSEVKTVQGQMNTLTSELDKARKDATEYMSRLAAEQDSVKRLASVTQTLSGDNKRLVADNDTLRSENRDVLAKLSNEQNRANQLATANTELKQKLDGTVTQLADAREMIKLHDEVFNRLSERNIEARNLIQGYALLPDIKAKVVTIDPATNLVVLNVGAKQGVRKNFDFTIFRGGEFVGKVNVFDTQDDLCAARIVTRKVDFKRGDDAWTRLQ